MMWIHGGAFTFGCGDDLFYGPDYLLRKDIILVTINYRLGIFGMYQCLYSNLVQQGILFFFHKLDT